MSESLPPPADTFPQWLAHRFSPSTPWDAMDQGDREYWAHEAAAVRRTVARNGFKQED